MNTTHTLGIDISKATFDAALFACAGTAPASQSAHKPKVKTTKLPNTPAGFNELLNWLAKLGVQLDGVHVAMEATGIYYEALAVFLCARGLKTSVVNPALISSFANANLSRTKTDKADAALIAGYCAAFRPAPWVAPAPQVRHLRELTRRLVDLKDLLAQESNRLEQARLTHPSIALVVEVLMTQIKLIEKQIKTHIDLHPELKAQAALLKSIPGVGAVTTATLLAEIEFDRFKRAPQLAAFTGLVPKIKHSGSSKNGRGVLSKAGSCDLRRSLYMPAVVAIKCNPLIKAFYARLLANGKSKMQALCACMRKLLSIAFGVIKSKQTFNPNYALAA